MKKKKYIIITAIALLIVQASIIPNIGADERSADKTENVGIEVDIHLKGGFGVKTIITNNYDFCLDEVWVDLHARGGIFGLINKTVFANISIPGGETKTIFILLFGLGDITVRAWITLVDLGVGTEIIKEGKQLLFFTRLY